MAFEIGQRVGDYEIIGVLGAGGMGKVYKVRNVLSDRIEAMKVILPDLAESQDLADRFLREIKVQAAMEHPHIAALRTAQRIGNQLVMIMEFVEGASLDQFMQQGPVPLKDSLDYASQVLDALDYAHKQGVVHRDIKPANIMITPGASVKLMDFGVAKLAADQKLTQTGSTIGSLQYMSPEQVQGLPNVDGRSDLYSLGVVLYEVVTGKPPFQADSQWSLMAAHIEKIPVAPNAVNPQVPDAVSSVIMMALAKDPKQRFQTAGAMRAALGGIRKSLGFVEGAPVAAVPAQAPPGAPAAQPAVQQPGAVPMPPPVARSGRRGLYMALGSVVTIGVLAAAVYFVPKYMRAGATSGEAQPQATPAAVEAVTPPVATPAAVSEPPASSTAAPTQIPAASAPSAGKTAVSQQRHQAPVTRPAASQMVYPGGGPAGGGGGAAVPAAGSAPPAAASAPPAAQSDAGASRAVLSQLRDEFNQMSIRVTTSKAGLQGLQNQMGGLGLRADMREAATRVDYLMQEAMTSIRNGDAEGARKNLDMADRNLEKIEKFLGR